MAEIFGKIYRDMIGASGSVLKATTDDDMTGSTTVIDIAALKGYGNDYFNTKYYIVVIRNTNSVGNAPENQCRQITDYVGSTGVFTTAAFGANVEADDEVMIVHESVALLALHADATLAKMVDDSWLAHILAVDGDVSDYNDNTMSLEALNIDLDAIIVDIAGAVPVTPTANSLQDIISKLDGANTYDNTKHSLEAIGDEARKLDSVTLVTSPVSDSLAAFVASGGTALGTELPASKSLYDEVRQFGDGYLTSKAITYDGSVSYAAFTVTGLVAVKVIGYITTVLTNHANSTSVGTATSAAGLIAATAGTAMQTANEAWVDNDPSKFETMPSNYSLIGDGEDIAVVGTANLIGGVVTLYCFWKPLTSDGAVAPV